MTASRARPRYTRCIELLKVQRAAAAGDAEAAAQAGTALCAACCAVSEMLLLDPECAPPPAAGEGRLTATGRAAHRTQPLE